MIERLEATLEKYNHLQEELTKQEVLSDIKKTREYSKEIANLEDVVTCYKKYKKVLEEIEDTKEMIKDPELGEMAKEELKTLQEEKENLDKELEILLIPISLLETYLECIRDTPRKKVLVIKYITQ